MNHLRETTSNRLFPVYLLLLTVALYWPALRIFFSLDDLRFLMKASGLDVQPFGLRRIVSVRFFFTTAWRLFDGHQWPYHLISLILHAANGWIVFILARRLGIREIAAGASSLLFIAAPVAFMPLHWISGIQEISMTFFALLAAFFYLGRGYASMAASLAAALLSLLCKESAFLLLPALAVVMPAPRSRRLILGIGGFCIALIVLWAVGSLESRPAGHPYETAIGIHILYNLLTYSAWIVRVWDYFPDRVPEYQTGLALWGLIPPLLIGTAFVRNRKIRLHLARASLLFLVLLLPVLPLVRHSYFYYLYLPLVPFWLLAGALLGKLRRRGIAAAILAAFIIYSALQGIRHRGAEITDGVLEDPILRYAETAGNAVAAFRAENGVMEGDLFVMTSAVRERVDLAAGLRGNSETERNTFLMVERALLEGRALKLFFPFVESVQFRTVTGEMTGWRNKHLYWTYGSGGMKYLGYGEEGLLKLIQFSMSAGEYDLADHEVRVMLAVHPNNPNLLYLLGEIALKRGDTVTLETMIEELERMAGGEHPPGSATGVLYKLKRMAAPPDGARQGQ